jgi:hypothetical protein
VVTVHREAANRSYRRRSAPGSTEGQHAGEDLTRVDVPDGGIRGVPADVSLRQRACAAQHLTEVPQGAIDKRRVLLVFEKLLGG